MRVKDKSEKTGLKLNIQNKQTNKQTTVRLWHPVPSLYGKQKGKKWNQFQIFSWPPKSLWMVTAAMKLKDLVKTATIDMFHIHVDTRKSMNMMKEIYDIKNSQTSFNKAKET